MGESGTLPLYSDWTFGVFFSGSVFSPLCNDLGRHRYVYGYGRKGHNQV